jgi:hypothetical protein
MDASDLRGASNLLHLRRSHRRYRSTGFRRWEGPVTQPRFRPKERGVTAGRWVFVAMPPSLRSVISVCQSRFYRVVLSLDALAANRSTWARLVMKSWNLKTR